ncbi:hypothetical protein M427DRAFT_277180 [Gonapodya prolifera JEL478]|uniref:Xylanolytic transcriptional activator regulatory domain-containing protein n=1 Tax=Gonapodya prolifera (strain JEL478) TaxID=1344416 RepID=A0A139AYD7_GONPJ|nr:hypothetical protein M427DRAFT_277180 [Gonapodya prolifera JEL478]|eukprot:KXS21720.1 hypothetical protein M427DRAFT_277180 [Gonapodya prolifera JEL478]
MVARETFPTVTQTRMQRLIADHAQAPHGTRPPAIIPAAAALGAFQLSRFQNVRKIDLNDPETGAAEAEYYLTLAAHLLDLAARSVSAEVRGEGMVVVNGAFVRNGGAGDRLSVLAAKIIGGVFSSSTMTMAAGNLYGHLSVQLGLKLGLNRESTVPPSGEPGDTWITREESRRIWWLIFSDQAIMPAWDNQPHPFTEEDIDLHLPCPDPLYFDPLLPPPDPIPFQRAFSLLTPPGYATSARSRASPTTSEYMNASSPGSATSESLRTLFHSGRTGISGYTVVLHGIAHRIMRLKRTQSFFGDGATLAEAWANEEKMLLSGMLDTWYSSLPDAVLAADRRAASEAGPEGIEPRSGVLFILYHTYKVLLYGRWDVISMVYDDAWLMSSDFLLCVEHADRVTRLIELVTAPTLKDDSGNLPLAVEMLRWASPYVIGAAVLMGSFVHAAVLRKLRLVNPGLIFKNNGQRLVDDQSSLVQLERGLIRKLELHISLAEALSNKWGLRSGMWKLMREELIFKDPAEEPNASPFFKLDYGPAGRGLMPIFLSNA